MITFLLTTFRAILNTKRLQSTSGGKKSPLLFCLFLSLLMLAAFSSSLASQWQNFTNKNFINDLAGDSQAVWCATTGGALRYDLTTAQIEQFTTAEGLGGTFLYSVTLDPLGNIWFGASNGTLTRLEPDLNRWTLYLFLDRDNRQLKLYDLFPEGNYLWVATDVGVILFDRVRNGGEIRETYRNLGSIPTETPVGEVLVSGGRIWAVAQTGVACASVNDPNLQDPSHWYSFTRTSSKRLPASQYFSIAEFDSTIYVGSDSGLFRYREIDSTWEQVAIAPSSNITTLFPFGDSLFSNTIYGLASYVRQPVEMFTYLSSDTLGTRTLNSFWKKTGTPLFIGTFGKGLGIFNGQTYSRIQIDGPPANVLLDITIDRRGRVWTTHWTGGIAMYDGTRWHTFGDSIPQAQGLGWAVAVDHNDNVWFTTWGAGAWRFGAIGGFTRFDSTNAPIHNVANATNFFVLQDVGVDTNNNVWFINLTPDSTVLLAYAPDSTWDVYYNNSTDGLVTNDINLLYPAGNHIWIGFQGGGATAGVGDLNYNGTLFNHTDDILTYYNETNNRLSSNNVTAIAIDRLGTLWVGTPLGLSRFDPDLRRFIAVQLPPPLGPRITSIAVDARNNKWIGTPTGLGLLNPDGQFEAIYLSTNSGLVSDEITELTIDPATGDLWIATGNPFGKGEGGVSHFQVGTGRALQEFQELRALPNPLLIEQGNEKVTFRGANLEVLSFEAQVSIYTTSGDLVRNLPVGADTWDAPNNYGGLVSGGIYLFRVIQPGKKAGVGKLAVIRK